MASPVYVGTGSATSSSGATSRTPGLPASRSNGDLLIAACEVKNNAVHTWSGTGWTKFDQVDSGAGFTVSLAYCIVNGSETKPTCSWSGSAAVRAHIFHWSGTDGASPFDGAHNSNTGSTSTHSCTGVTTTRADSRVIYIDGASAAVVISTDTPSGWTEDHDISSGLSLTRFTVGGKDIASSGSASGDISITGENAAWVMWQIELRSPGGTSSPLLTQLKRGMCRGMGRGFRR